MSTSNDSLFSIGEAADLLGVSISTLRMYERMGLLLPERRESKHRLYHREDLDRVAQVRALIKHRALTLEDIRQMLAGIPCWEIKNCPEEMRAACSMYRDHNVPCWLAPQRARMRTRNDCRQCEVYVFSVQCLLNGKPADSLETR